MHRLVGVFKAVVTAWYLARHTVPAHLRLGRTQLATQMARQGWIALQVIRIRSRFLLLALFVAIAATLVDAYISRQVVSFIDGIVPRAILRFPDDRALISFLSSTIAGTAAVLGLLVTISLLVIGRSAEKFGNSAVRYLLREPVANFVQDLLLAALLLAMWTLFQLRLGVVRPYFSMTLLLAMFALALLSLAVFRMHALSLLDLRSAARGLRAEVISAAWNSRTAQPEVVAAYHRGQAHQALSDLTEMTETALRKGEVSDAQAGVLAMGEAVARYLQTKTRIAPQSAWFPRRVVPCSEESDAGFSQTQIYLRVAAGPPTMEEVDEHWVEDVAVRLGARARGHNDREIVRSACEMILAMLRAAVSVEDESTASRLLDEFRLSVATLSRIDREAATLQLQEVVGVAYQTLRLSNAGSIDQSALNWSRPAAIIGLGLPIAIRAEILALQRQLQPELIVEGAVITPAAWIDGQLGPKLRMAEARVQHQIVSTVLSHLVEFGDSGAEDRLPIAPVLEVTLRHRCLVQDQASLVQENLKSLGARVLHAWTAEEDTRFRSYLVQELEEVCMLSAARDQAELFEELMPSFIATNADIARLDERQSREAASRLISVLAFSFLVSEFEQNDKYVSAASQSLDHAYASRTNRLLSELDDLARDRLAIFFFPSERGPEIRKYSYFAEIYKRVRSLPVRLESVGPRTYESRRVADHPSALIREISGRLDDLAGTRIVDIFHAFVAWRAARTVSGS